MSLLKDLIKNNEIIPAISDTIFKRLMIKHKEYLGLILENIIPITKEEIINDVIFLNNK